MQKEVCETIGRETIDKYLYVKLNNNNLTENPSSDCISLTKLSFVAEEVGGECFRIFS
jgi:hypothetical protein